MTDETEFIHNNPETVVDSQLPGVTTIPISTLEPSSISPHPSLSSLKITDMCTPEPTKSTENFEIVGSEAVLTVNEEEESSKGLKKTRYIGLLLAILSSLMFSINALIFKMLDYNPPLIPAFYMFLGTTVLAFFLYLYYLCSMEKLEIREKMSLKMVVVLLARGFTGCSGMLLFFYSLQYLSIGDALVIACSSPVFVFLLAFIFLKENCGIVPVATIILALIGVVVITRPPLLTGEESFKKDDLIGAGLAFASMLAIASTLVLMRFLQNIHHSLINLTFGVWGTIQTAALALILGTFDYPKSIVEAAIMSTTGLVFWLGQTFLAVALQLEEAGPVSLIRTSEVLFAFIWQLVFLKVVPDLFSISGAIFIMIGILTTILRKWISSLPTSHSARQRFSLLLR